MITCRKSFSTLATYRNAARYVHVEIWAAGSGKAVQRSQGWFDTNVMVSQLVNLSWKFPIEVHKQVQPDRSFSPLTCTRKPAFLTPFSCRCLEPRYPRRWFIPYFQQMQFCSEVLPQRKPADLEQREVAQCSARGWLTPAKEEGQQQGVTFFNTEREPCIC